MGGSFLEDIEEAISNNSDQEDKQVPKETTQVPQRAF